MDPQQQFCLKWNSFGNNLVTTFETLFKSESLTDVTLFCEGVTFKAHKIILAACSKHFQDLFEAAPFCPNILVILDGTSSGHMSALLEFMYKGEVHVSQESLSGFLKAAESLQIKGLSMEQERLVGANSSRVSDLSFSGSKTPTGLPPSFKLVSNDNGDASEGMHPPSSTAYNSILSPYLHYRGGNASPYDHPPPRKRHHRAPSDSGTQRERASVLVRGGGLPERESPLPLTFSPISPHHEFTFHRTGDRGIDRDTDHIDSSNSSSTLPFASQETVAVDNAAPPSISNPSRSSPEWRNSQEPPSNSCPEDLRIKTENRSSSSDNVASNANGSSNGNSGDHNHRPGSQAQAPSPSRPDSNHHDMNHVEDSWRERESNREPLPGGKQSALGGGDHGADRERGTTLWNSTTGTGYPTSHEISNAHKSAIATSTPTGKKLQCPYCERLYGYETNLRAHIRQRHQGIRAPCPYCSRTFTRNNTVRRHIAREHKTELNLTAKAFQLSQVQNHNQ